MKGGKVEILVNDQGNRITPSYVAWNDEERLVGDAGRPHASMRHMPTTDIHSQPKINLLQTRNVLSTISNV